MAPGGQLPTIVAVAYRTQQGNQDFLHLEKKYKKTVRDR
jgi:hypothetical protein